MIKAKCEIANWVIHHSGDALGAIATLRGALIACNEGCLYPDDRQVIILESPKILQDAIDSLNKLGEKFYMLNDD